MGTRIYFLKPKSDLSLAQHLERDYPEFRDWMIIENLKSQKEDNEDRISLGLQQFLEDNEYYSTEIKVNQNIIDELVSAYLLAYCDLGPGQSNFELVGPLLNRFRYEELSKSVKSLGDPHLIQIFKYLLGGRSLLNNAPFSPSFEQSTGWWTPDEQDFIVKHLGQLRLSYEESELVHSLVEFINELEPKSDLIIVAENN
ncbi:hypothetical protein GYB29_16290 [bacterium]|nr:hypothetical protein [bacterium]